MAAEGEDMRDECKHGSLRRKCEICERDDEIASLKEANAAQLAELHSISDALGTNEGHSSVDHIERLKSELAAANNSCTMKKVIEQQNEISRLRALCINTADLIANDGYVGLAITLREAGRGEGI